MNARILVSLLTIAVASSAMGYGTYAFFSDTETSAGNLFTAGTLDLTIGAADGVTSTISAAAFAPGDSVSGSILLKNVGSVVTGDAQGHTVDLDLKAVTVVTDDSGNPSDADDGGVSTVPLSHYLVLTSLTYDGSSILSALGDRDGDGRANTLADLELLGAVTDLADPGSAGKTLAMTVQFDGTAGNDLKRDVASVAFTFFLAQAGEADLS